VEKIYIYKEIGPFEQDFKIMKLILEYAETPQYLRKYLFPKNENLREVGILPPLRTPHHKPYIHLEDLRVGDVREGVILKKSGINFVDIGLKSIIKYNGHGFEGERITAVVQALTPEIICSQVLTREIKEYWGYKVVRVGSIGRALKSGFSGLKIITSRLGEPAEDKFGELSKAVREADSVALIFGSPRKGLYGILKEENLMPENVADFSLNFVPGQGTVTVRSEEAILISLSIINLIKRIRE
jgi:predicted SPOUT superfamily RNA methylase MTH1